MLLLYCKNCGDVYSLRNTSEKRCSCEQTSGRLENDKITFSGDAFCINISDESLTEGLIKQIQQNSRENQKLDSELLAKNSILINPPE